MKKCVVAILNQKGGVGKTTTCVNLAAALAIIGKRVLLIDLDPQGNATTGLGVQKGEGLRSSYGVLLGMVQPKEVICECGIPNLYVLPSTIDLAAAEIELYNLEHRESQLRKGISALEYEYIFVDCPPGFGLINLNALNAANKIIIPLQCEFYALEGLAQLFHTIAKVRNSINRDLEIAGILLTMYDRRSKLSPVVEKDVKSHFKNLVFDTIIPRNVRVSEAPSHGKPVILYDLKCLGSVAYIALANEFLHKTGR